MNADTAVLVHQTCGNQRNLRLALARRINEIVQRTRAIDPDTALRLSRYSGLSERFWMSLQARYDREVDMDRLKKRTNSEADRF